jgi:signal transduction histidine kinase/DNA-binding response OmpR family regulator/HAMP domain-containing protein
MRTNNQGPLARQLLFTFAGLVLIVILATISLSWAMQVAGRAQAQFAELSRLAGLSARIRSECLTLTEMVREYTLRSNRIPLSRETIYIQEDRLDALIQLALRSIDPNDVDDSIQISRIRLGVIAFSQQANLVLDAHDAEAAYGSQTAAAFQILTENFQDPLLLALSEFEERQAVKAELADRQARRIFSTAVVAISATSILIIASALLMSRQVILRFVAPLDQLRNGVEQIRQGNLSIQVPVQSSDEMGNLAQALNDMSAELALSRQQLEAYALTLEQQVGERTREAERRALQAQTAAEVAQSVSSILDVDELIPLTVNLIHQRFGLYYVGLFLVDAAFQYAWLRAGTGEAGRKLLESQFNLPIDTNSMIGWVILNRQPRIALDVSQDPAHYQNPLLPESKSEMALPLITRGEVIGGLTVQSSLLADFKSGDLTILQTMAGQLANAIGNARLYGEAQREKQHAQAANRAKSTFLANMSHEIRTPLNAILGFTALLQLDKNLTLDQKTNIDTIHRSGEALLSLINSILDLSKIEAGRMTLNEHAFNLHLMLRNLEDLFRLRALENGLALAFEISPETPQVVEADEAKLRQVLINLLGNALKFTRQGRVVLRCRLADPEEATTLDAQAAGDCAFLYFSVEDTGVGIAESELQRIFEPFTQASVENALPQGTGLGLTISRQFIQLMRGKLGVESVVGQGSLFWMVIPVGAAPGFVLANQSTPAPTAQLAEGQPAYRLLVVDDRAEGRGWLVALLKRMGFEVQEAANGRQAIEAWQAWHPDLIWMDMRMPVMDGRQATREIKALPDGNQTVIIALTASAFEDQRSQMLADGCDDFLRKPVQVGELVNLLQKHLGAQFIDSIAPQEGYQDSRQRLDRQEWQSISKDWIVTLRQAALEGDFDLITGLVAEIEDQQPRLARILTELVKDFDVRGIVAILPEME